MNYKIQAPRNKYEAKSNVSNMTSFSKMSVGTFFHMVNKPCLSPGSVHNNMLFQAYKLEALKLETDTMMDVNINKL
jgi:hypothetical protein